MLWARPWAEDERKVVTVLAYCYLRTRQEELEAIKARVREMEEEAEKLKELQNEVEKQMNMSPPPGNGEFAYIEFSDKESVRTSLALDESLFRGRQIKVIPKRTNRPGISTTDRGFPRARYRARTTNYNSSRSRFYSGFNSRPRGRVYRFL
ncbi:polyadenylate-binding protein 2 [Cricetulus griseus]|nr:polyadenylate-binding protein 2 [Cricetulus griseus]